MDTTAIDMNETLITLTSDIVAAHVSNNDVPVDQLSVLISSVYGALAGLGAPGNPTQHRDIEPRDMVGDEEHRADRPGSVRSDIEPGNGRDAAQENARPRVLDPDQAVEVIERHADREKQDHRRQPNDDPQPRTQRDFARERKRGRHAASCRARAARRKVPCGGRPAGNPAVRQFGVAALRVRDRRIR